MERTRLPRLPKVQLPNHDQKKIDQGKIEGNKPFKGKTTTREIFWFKKAIAGFDNWIKSFKFGGSSSPKPLEKRQIKDIDPKKFNETQKALKKECAIASKNDMWVFRF